LEFVLWNWAAVTQLIERRFGIKLLVQGVDNYLSRWALFLDKLRVNHSEPVKAWVDERQDKIEPFYLSSYSPELSLEERLNADLKHVLLFWDWSCSFPDNVRHKGFAV